MRNESTNWQSDDRKHMFGTVNRRLLRPLIFVLVAAQALLSAPLATAMSVGAASTSQEMPCADTMPQTEVFLTTFLKPPPSRRLHCSSEISPN